MVLVHVHRFPNKQNHTRNPPKRHQPSHAQFPQTIPTIPRAIHPNETVGAAPACPPERPHSSVSMPRTHALCMGNLTTNAPLWGDSGGHTGTAPTNLHHIFPHNPTQTKEPFTRNPPKRHQPPLSIPTKPCGASLPHRGYTFDSAGLASATQPTLGNNASEEATPLGVVLFLITHHHHTAANGLFANDSPARKLILKSTMPMA